MRWKQIKSKNKKTVKKVPYVDLRRSPLDLSSYDEELERIFDSRRIHSEHCEEYEELTMEEKLLVDADVDFLINEGLINDAENSLMFWGGMDKYTLEKCLARLRKRDRENDKRNRK